jgi:hypothetical protein
MDMSWFYAGTQNNYSVPGPSTEVPLNPYLIGAPHNADRIMQRFFRLATAAKNAWTGRSEPARDR